MNHRESVRAHVVNLLGARAKTFPPSIARHENQVFLVTSAWKVLERTSAQAPDFLSHRVDDTPRAVLAALGDLSGCPTPFLLYLENRLLEEAHIRQGLK